MTPDVAMLATDLASAFDPVQFSIRAGITPDPWQAELLRSPATEILLNCSRQSGKSTTSATLAAHTAIYRPRSLTIMLGPSERQAKELLRKVKELLASLGNKIEQAESDTATWLEFPNGSRIIALPGKDGTIRGFSGVDLLLIDEASRVADTLYQAVRPMLAVSGGRLVLLSTPFGQRGHFYQEWTEGGPSWHRIRVTAAQCPRISPEWLDRERAAIGDWWFRQEYGCEFVATDDQLFTSEMVTMALDPTITPLFGGAL